MTKKTAQRPRVSFVVPAFNELPAILEESLASVMAQSFQDFECIVIDESTDHMSAAAAAAICSRDPRFRYTRPDRRLGLAASLNLGIEMARGALIARFDSDDVCMPDRLALQVDFMDAYPEIGVLGGGLEIMDKAGSHLAFRDYPKDHATIARRIHVTTPFAHPTVMMRRSLIQSAGRYNPDFRFSEDLDLWLRLLNRGTQFANLDRTLVRYRQQNTRRNPDHWRYNLQARRKNFAMPNMLRRLAGIGAISLWIHTPPVMQEVVFKMLLLNRHDAALAKSA